MSPMLTHSGTSDLDCPFDSGYAHQILATLSTHTTQPVFVAPSTPWDCDHCGAPGQKGYTCRYCRHAQP